MTTMWTVRGVSAEGRKNAKMAAAASGAPVGKWLERAIENLASAELYDRAKAELPKKEKGVASEAAANPATTEYHSVSSPLPERAKKALKPKKVCQHGTPKGENCWKCGGLARIDQ
jgi:hypothetical protein